MSSRFTVKVILSLLAVFSYPNLSFSQITYPENESGVFEDILTPEYYLSEVGTPFRNEINQLIYLARVSDAQHPLEDANGEIPSYEITRSFGVGIGGPTGTSQHHAAIDMRIGNNATTVPLFAVHSGNITTYFDAPKYRQYLAITKELVDSTGNPIGKMVTLYGHIDLDLDIAGGLDLNGQYVERGDTVSMNLYAETVGGPHLHFEIRLYRPSDNGDETYYSFVEPGGSEIFTEPSVGSWSYGFWNPELGYGFANPENHIYGTLTGLSGYMVETPSRSQLSQNYPNPFNPTTTIVYTLAEQQNIMLEVFDMRGVKVYTLDGGLKARGSHTAHFNGRELSSGLYFYRLTTKGLSITKKMMLVK